MKRAVAIYFPYLATDRLRSRIGGRSPDEGVPSRARQEAEPLGRSKTAPLRSRLGSGTESPDAGLVVIAQQASVTRVVGADARAESVGIRVGMPLAEARALLDSAGALTVRDQSIDADREAIESLAVWADRYSPCVQIETDDTLLLDLSGCERLYPDEACLLDEMASGLRRLGYFARIAVADTPRAALAMVLACADDLSVAPPGRTAAALGPLPVGALCIDADTAQSLAVLGVQTIEALMHLPRASLASRFGDRLLHRLDQALGDAPELLTPFRAPRVLQARLQIGRPTTETDILTEAMTRVLGALCAQLEQQVAGARQLFVAFERPELRPVTFEMNVSRATRSAAHLRSLLVTRLDAMTTECGPAGVRGVIVWCRRTEPLDGRQEDLFDSGGADGERLGDLVDRLAHRLGSENVLRPEPVGDHQPEYAVGYVEVLNGKGPRDQGTEGPRGKLRGTGNGERGTGTKAKAKTETKTTTETALRPLRLFGRAVATEVIAAVPEGPPACFVWRGRRETVVDCAGPERIETGWWRGLHVRRDYYRVTCESGRRAWLFRERNTAKWFVHGWFD